MIDLRHPASVDRLTASLEPFQLSIAINQREIPEGKTIHENSLSNLSSEDLEIIEMSGGSKRKLRQKIAWLLHLHTSDCTSKAEKEQKFKYHTCLITLTLSSAQVHSDKWIKKNMLNQFLVELRNESINLNYVWKAEKQENGNIHFHILINRRIGWRNVRTTWNRIQDKCGYIAPYTEIFGGTDPNSTDVHGLVKVKKVYNYLLKYLCKPGTDGSIEGRVWAASNSLKGLSHVKVNLGYDKVEMLDWLVSNDELTKWSNDHCVVYYGDIFDVLQRYDGPSYVSLIEAINEQIHKNNIHDFYSD